MVLRLCSGFLRVMAALCTAFSIQHSQFSGPYANHFFSTCTNHQEVFLDASATPFVHQAVFCSDLGVRCSIIVHFVLARRDSDCVVYCVTRFAVRWACRQPFISVCAFFRHQHAHSFRYFTVWLLNVQLY